MKKSKLLTLCLSAVMGASLLAGCGTKATETVAEGKTAAEGEGQETTAPVEKITWKLAHISNEEHYWHKIAQEFARLVNEKTNGQMEIVIYPNSQLGSETDVLNGILQGTCDMTITGESLSAWIPTADLLAPYFAYQSEEHVEKVINSDIGKKIISDIEAVGFKPLFYVLRAPRNLTSNIPVRTPEDMKNVKIRLSNSAQAIACWKAIGSSPQVMGLSECFTALNQGVVDAQENPYDLIYSSGFYDVQKYVNETEHVFSYIFFTVGNKQFDALTPELQQAVIEASAEAQEYGKKLYYEQKESSKQACIEKGMEIVSDVDKDAFREAMAPAIQEYFGPELYELYKQIVALGEEN